MKTLDQTIVLATRNAGKVVELSHMLAALPVLLISAADIEKAPEVVEDADTLQGNAEKKARALFDLTGLPALADDTGLEVNALDGAPGVQSARYAGEQADDAANRTKLLLAMAGREDRSALFRTVLAYMDDEDVHYFDGVCEGVITAEERGDGGFGYDRIFQPTDADGSTFAEMNKEEKNRISHRGRALAQFVRFMEERIMR